MLDRNPLFGGPLSPFMPVDEDCATAVSQSSTPLKESVEIPADHPTTESHRDAGASPSATDTSDSAITLVNTIEDAIYHVVRQTPVASSSAPLRAAPAAGPPQVRAALVTSPSTANPTPAPLEAFPSPNATQVSSSMPPADGAGTMLAPPLESTPIRHRNHQQSSAGTSASHRHRPYPEPSTRPQHRASAYSSTPSTLDGAVHPTYCISPAIPSPSSSMEPSSMEPTISELPQFQPPFDAPPAPAVANGGIGATPLRMGVGYPASHLQPTPTRRSQPSQPPSSRGGHRVAPYDSSKRRAGRATQSAESSLANATRHPETGVEGGVAPLPARLGEALARARATGPLPPNPEVILR